MRKLHQNLFYYYRGPIKSDNDIDPQIENNTTKALINVLENCTISNQTKIIGRLISKNVPNSVDKIHYSLQSRTIGKERIKKLRNRFLVGISPLGEVFDQSSVYEQQSVPDAWIWSSNFVICIENKIQGELHKEQLDQHAKALGTNHKRITLSWRNDIYPIISEFSANATQEPDRMLLREFKKYLEVIGMSGFEGFEIADFNAIFCKDDERDNFDYLRHKVDQLIRELQNESRLGTLKYNPAKPRFPDRDIGWYGFYSDYQGPKKIFTECTDTPHFSIFFDKKWPGINIKLHCMNRPLSDLIKSIKNSSGKRKFYETLKKLNKTKYEYRISVSEQMASDRPYAPGDWGCTYSIYSGYIDDKRLDVLTSILNNSHPKKWFNIYCILDPRTAEDQGKDVVKNLAEIVQELWGPYTYLAGEK